jgi:molybdopterin converting factor small subunit
MITIELFGVPRARAGQAEFVTDAATVGAALSELIAVCPGLAELIRADGGVHGQYLLSLDGKRFVTDLAECLQPGDRLLLLSADPGG